MKREDCSNCGWPRYDEDDIPPQEGSLASYPLSGVRPDGRMAFGRGVMKGPRVTDRYGWRRCIICGQKWKPVCEQHGKELGDVVREFIAHAQIKQDVSKWPFVSK